MKRMYLNVLKYMFPLLFILYMGSISLFGHLHIVNGVTIVHSHPFGDQTGHEHSTSEFQLIHILSHIIVAGVIVAFFTLVKPSVVLYTLSIKPRPASYIVFHRGTLSLRAPPCSC